MMTHAAHIASALKSATDYACALRELSDAVEEHAVAITAIEAAVVGPGITREEHVRYRLASDRMYHADTAMRGLNHTHHSVMEMLMGATNGVLREGRKA